MNISISDIGGLCRYCIYGGDAICSADEGGPPDEDCVHWRFDRRMYDADMRDVHMVEQVDRIVRERREQSEEW